MKPTKDQERLKLHSKGTKLARATPWRVGAWIAEILAFCSLPLAFFTHPIVAVLLPVGLAVRWMFLIQAGRVYGPHLGEDHGRAYKATLEDARKARLT